MLIRMILICFLFFSCSFYSKSIAKKKINDISTVDVTTKSIYRYDQEAFSVSINYASSYSNFVFYKESDFFKSSLLAIMQIYDIKNDSIILQESWPIDITLPHNLYKKTKSNEKQIIFIKDDVSLDEGEYDLIINIKDLDNNNLIKFKENFILQASEGFGNVELFADGNEIDEKLNIEQKQLKFDFQYFDKSNKSENKIIKEVKLELRNNDNIHSQVFDSLKINQDIYQIDFLVPDGFYGEMIMEIIINDHQKSKTVTLFDSNVNLWSDDVYEIVGVMRYIFTASEMRKMKNLSDKEKIDYIVAYWEKNDPNTETKVNELLDELTIRFRFVNENLSDISGGGWKTDRGQIYLMHGKPFTVERYTNRNNDNFEVWKYKTGEEFLFEDNKFGSFVLIRRSIS
tara:strand:- start:240 stop:1439 length:1200 start_codon:yes stop_codon:yes gene_type:complete